MTWNPFDYAGDFFFLPWKDMGWRQRITATLCHVVAWGVVYPILCVGMVYIAGAIIAGR